MEHPFFGPLSASDDEWTWERVVDLGGRSVQVDLTSDVEPTEAQLDAAAIFVRELLRFDVAARAAMLDDTKDGTTVREYIDHHVAELPRESLEALFDTTKPARFLDGMVLQRVGLYPSGASRIAVFDYTLDQNVTNYLLVVGFQAGGTITSIDMES